MLKENVHIYICFHKCVHILFVKNVKPCSDKILINYSEVRIRKYWNTNVYCKTSFKPLSSRYASQVKVVFDILLEVSVRDVRNCRLLPLTDFQIV